MITSPLRNAAFVVLSLGLASSPVGAASGAQGSVAISSCETFRDWFAAQPGGKLVSLAPGNPSTGLRPLAFDSILTYRWDTKPSDPAFKQMQFYRTNLGSGGCMAGYYVATASTALIFLTYGTATDLVITKTTSIPSGLPTHPVPTATKRGATLGMSIAAVEKIEGSGTTYGKNAVVTLYYNQNVKDSYGGTLYGHLAFLFVGGKVAAINAGGGH